MSIAKLFRPSYFLILLVIGLVIAYVHIFGLKTVIHSCVDSVRDFSGKSYRIQICRAGYDDRSAYAILRVLSMENKLLAEVPVEYALGRAEESAIFFNNDSIEYGGPYDSLKKISIPPTRLDWIRARLP